VLVMAARFPLLTAHITTLCTDFQVKLLPEHKLSDLPVIVEVDEKSLALNGQWPWPRYRVAKLLDAIRAMQPAAIGVDALFAESDRTSPAAVLDNLAHDFNNPPSKTAFPAVLPDYDQILGQALGKGPFVLSYFFSFNGTTLNPCQPQSAQGNWISEQGAELAQSQLFKADHTVCNIAPLEQGASHNGFINSASDEDGLFRKTPLVIEYKNRLFPSLALQTYLLAKGIKSFSVTPDELGLTLNLDGFKVPLDQAGNALLRLPNAGQAFPRVSAADIVTGKTDPAKLLNKTVLIGFSATGLHEYRPTPFSPQFLGVELHATVIDNLDRQDFLQRPANALWLELLSGAFLCIALMTGLSYARPLVFTLVPLAVAGVIALCSQFMLANTGLVISPALPVAIVLLAFVTLALIKYSREYLHARKMTKLVSLTQDGIIESFCSMCEYRDPETGSHIKRTQHYIKALASHLSTNSTFSNMLTPDYIDLLFKAAPLHDIGKIGIRDHILLKPGKLADEEFTIMKSHPVIGAEIINTVAKQIGWNPFMQVAHSISLYHQEKWDGSGYPYGLSGENIPLPARFMALADVYDALISKRIYKPAFSHEMAVEIIRKTSDTHFDPVLTEGFLQIHVQFREIALRFLDDEEQKNTLLGIQAPQ
jgi:adenylate cyclase